MSKCNDLLLQVMIATQRGRTDESGQGLAEYALILALVAILCVGALTTLKGGITNAYNSMTAAF
jgi:pilus assembly protein Flp/PilA